MTAPVRNYPQLAEDIVDLVGGESNIRTVTHCATRLRLVLHHTPAEAKERVSALPGVITVVQSGGQFQVVIGANVVKVHTALTEKYSLSGEGDAGARKPSIVNRVIATMSGVFAPFVYILAAAGLLQGALIVLRMLWEPFTGTGTDEVLSFISWTPFSFLPIFIAITASRHFRTNTYVAVLCCAALINPDWSAMAERIQGGESIDFLGIALNPTVYTSSVLPPLILVWLLSYLERFLDRILKGVAHSLLAPLISVLVLVPLVLLVLGPLSAGGASGVANGYNWLVEVAPVLAAIIIGGFWQVAVIFGVHWGVTPFVLDNFDRFGSDTFQAFQTAAVVAQVGAAFGVFLRTRNKEMRGVAGSAGITGIFGITEPTIYGVTLRLKRPFLLACIAGAAGAVVIALFNGRYYAYAGLPSLLTTVNASDPGNPGSLTGVLLGSGVALVGALLLTYFVGFKDIPAEAEVTDGEAAARADGGASGPAASVAPTPAGPAASAAGPADPEGSGRPAAEQGLDAARLEDAVRSVRAEGADGVVVASPLSGRVVPLAEVRDETFASGVMGPGVAVDPDDGRVRAPFDGTVVTVFPTKHAVGLRSEDGVEALIHVGMDTVKLRGEHFTAHVEAGSPVRAGDLLVEFDREGIAAAGYSLVTPLVLTNAGDFAQVITAPAAPVRAGDDVAVVLAHPSADAGGRPERV